MSDKTITNHPIINKCEEYSYPPEFYANDFRKQGFNYYSEGAYRLRNIVLVEMIRRFKPVHIFEFAGAEGDLAELILEACPTVCSYTWSDFVPEAVEHASQKLMRFAHMINLRLIDIDKKYSDIAWHSYDMIISTALEHIQHDREIIESIPTGTYIALCLPSVKWESHLHTFQTWKEIEIRYPSLHIKDACTMSFTRTQDYNKKFLFIAQKGT